MARSADGSVCHACGGSGWIIAAYFAADDEGLPADFEGGQCDNCAGTGWEPPEYDENEEVEL